MTPEPASPAGCTEEILSVSALNRLAREALERRFPLLWIAGEISNLRRPSSGHVYFSLKDENAQVNCAMFRGRAQLLPFKPEEGMRVEARALVTLYETRGDFQLNVEALRRAGIGVLFEAFARLREKLEREGLFAEERKKPLPRFPRRVGVITSPHAAALSDVLATLARRSPHLPVLLYPTPVQGETAAEKIAAAIAAAAKRAECDVLIVARGGGSIEDLWSFNEEEVARAIAACPVPLITGIGHETDTTIADLVADRRAATPTAAAELASAGYAEARHALRKLATALEHAMRRGLEARMQRVDLLARGVVRPSERLARMRAEIAHCATRLTSSQRSYLLRYGALLQELRARCLAARPELRRASLDLHGIGNRLRRAAASHMKTRRLALDAIATNLAHLDPEAVLRRGYSLVRKPDGSIVRSSRQIALDEALELRFGLGWARAQVIEKEEPPKDIASLDNPD